MKATFLSLEEQLLLAKPLKDLRNVVAMFGLAPGIDNDVMNVYDHKQFRKFWSTSFMKSWNTEPNSMTRYL